MVVTSMKYDPGVNICPSQAELCIGNNWSVKLPFKWIIFKFIYGGASSMAGKICAELYVLKIDICFSRWKEECSESLCSESERGREGGHSGFHHCVADNNRVYTHTHTYTYTYTCKCKHSHLFSGFHQHCDVEQQLCVYTYIVTPSANNQVLCCV